MNYYKVLGENGEPCNGGTGVWSLPKGKRPGKWMPAIKDLEPCVRGYHLCRRADLVHWLGPEIYSAEIRGEIIKCENKVVVSQGRLLRRVPNWNPTTQRLFACECAERVAHLNSDKRVMGAIVVAPIRVVGAITCPEGRVVTSPLSAGLRCCVFKLKNRAFDPAIEIAVIRPHFTGSQQAADYRQDRATDQIGK